MSDYAELKTLPALMSVIFAIASLYQFGGISEVHIVWADYMLTTEHAMFVSLGAYAIAFASSETKDFSRYEAWEKGLIAAGPVLIVGHQYSDFLGDLIATESHTGPVIAFLVAVIAWGVAIR